ncbi:MAG: tripartite tricarboxylate transporter substrate binding protein [Betaproteobacteria bacterium]|nr:tripartite tricarboxylate transporter substrate binding protein [Betaproteobacteria bacterium]
MLNTLVLRALMQVLVLALTMAGNAIAAGYPERPITIITSAAAGGANDILARVLAKPLNQALGQPIVVENRGGAGGIVGIGAVARARPDGYTLLLTSSSYVLLPSIRKQIPYDPYKDFMPIVEIGVSPNVFITHPDSGINSVADLIALARSSDRVNYGTPGIGTTPQLAAEVLKMRAKINMVSVPFSGAAPTVQALLSRQVQVVVAALGSAMPQISGGLVKAIVQTGKERWPDLPNVPTMAEAGIPDAVSETFFPVFAPAGTPPEIIDRLAKESIAILKQRDIRDRMRQTGVLVTASGPDALRARVVQEVPKWKDVLEKAGIMPE